jgi:gliding motility-associated-like protein
MLKRYLYILFSCMALSGTLRIAGQMAMPDDVFAGQTKKYNVDLSPVLGSIFTWWIDGVVQDGFTANEFVHTWNAAGTYLLEVQERSADGCPGAVRSGQVFVNSLPAPVVDPNAFLIIPEAFSPNKDLINDVWEIGNSDLYPLMEITIYNRWGQVVWKSEKGYPVPWDGRSRGSDLPVDSYHYIIELHNGLKPIVGTITIIR